MSEFREFLYEQLQDDEFREQWEKVQLLMEQKRRTERAGIKSEYVITVNSGRIVKESVTGTFKAFCNYVGAEYKPSHTCRRSSCGKCLKYWHCRP
ncbi:MAG: hypothetical protein K2O16_10500 [Lachnospiraceae bacterium]|nr:hypothetical protein [Lachnospiraceae bacterium]